MDGGPGLFGGLQDGADGTGDRQGRANGAKDHQGGADGAENYHGGSATAREDQLETITEEHVGIKLTAQRG